MFWWILLTNLVSEHKCDYFQNMQTPLLLTLGWRQELDQVIKAADVNGPQQSVVDAGIIIHFLGEKDNKIRQIFSVKSSVKNVIVGEEYV